MFRHRTLKRSRPTQTASRSRRRGVTLLEVLLATAIMAIALTALGRRGFVAIRAAEKSRQQAEAVLIARSALDGLLAHTLRPAATETRWSDTSEWLWWSETTPSETAGLVTLRVHVREPSDSPRVPTLTLAQLVRPEDLPGR